jgi:hypothetical protein
MRYKAWCKVQDREIKLTLATYNIVLISYSSFIDTWAFTLILDDVCADAAEDGAVEKN